MKRRLLFVLAWLEASGSITALGRSAVLTEPVFGECLHAIAERVSVQQRCDVSILKPSGWQIA